MTRYYQTDTGYGAADDDEMQFPDSWAEITSEQYDALVAADAQAAADVKAAAIAAGNVRWSVVHNDLIAAGVSDEAAVLLANVVGIRPA